MAKEKEKKKEKEKDGKGKSSCLGCLTLLLIIIVLLGIFIGYPFYKRYENEISSNTFVEKFRNDVADKIDEWNFRFIRPAQDKAEEIQEEAKEVIENPQLIIEKAEQVFDEPLLDD